MTGWRSWRIGQARLWLRLPLALAGVALAWLAVEWQRPCRLVGLRSEPELQHSCPNADLLRRDQRRWLPRLDDLPEWLPGLVRRPAARSVAHGRLLEEGSGPACAALARCGALGGGP